MASEPSSQPRQSEAADEEEKEPQLAPVHWNEEFTYRLIRAARLADFYQSEYVAAGEKYDLVATYLTAAECPMRFRPDFAKLCRTKIAELCRRYNHAIERQSTAPGTAARSEPERLWFLSHRIQKEIVNYCNKVSLLK